jgi:hypothetical protein
VRRRTGARRRGLHRVAPRRSMAARRPRFVGVALDVVGIVVHVDGFEFG